MIPEYDEEQQSLLPVKSDGLWKFPSTSVVRFATSRRDLRELPLYVTYSEFQQKAASDVHETPLPTRAEVLHATRQIEVPSDFLSKAWMRDVRAKWQASIEPKFSFASGSTHERYWWCEVKSAKGWNVHTYILLATDAKKGLVRYAFYSGEPKEGRSYCVRFHDKHGRETEVSYKSARGLLAGVGKMSRSGDNMICCEKNRDEYIQTCRNRDGSFYVEYQLYHMPWQKCCKRMSRNEVVRLIRKYDTGGVAAIANEFKWQCCDRPERKAYDLGVLLAARLRKALSHGTSELVETIRALGVDGTNTKRLVVPLFLMRGRPVEWTTSLFYLPRNCAKSAVAATKVAAALTDATFANYAHEVGELFFEGRGVERNYRLALYWEKVARRHGLSKADSAIARLKNLMDPQRSEKSAVLRDKYVREIDDVVRIIYENGINDEEARERIVDVYIACECLLHEGRLIKRDFSLVSKRGALALKGLPNRP